MDNIALKTSILLISIALIISIIYVYTEYHNKQLLKYYKKFYHRIILFLLLIIFPLSIYGASNCYSLCHISQCPQIMELLQNNIQ
jgi:hypothetical protein